MALNLLLYTLVSAPVAGSVVTGGSLPDAKNGESTFPVVGIGASAGGLAALQKFFESIPDNPGMAFVVIVHLDPSRDSHMAELLQTRTAMPVRQVTRRTKVEAGHVYIIPPDKDLTLTDGHFRLSPRSQPNRSRAPIDKFLRTLAEIHGSEAIGIVLSGTGSDGTKGLGSVREAGGITMVQDPAEAEYSGMPSSAIATGQVDIVLPVAQLALEVIRVFDGERRSTLKGSKAADKANEATVDRILALVRATTGHDFAPYKRATVNRRLLRRLQFSKAGDLEDYHRMLTEAPHEIQALYDDFLITVTGFFRDPDAFDSLEHNVIPNLFEQRAEGDPVRAWVTACATGEEAYSLAILLCEEAERRAVAPQIQIFATDVHERAFSLAREGHYVESSLADVTPERLEKFFSRDAGGYRVRKSIREKVIFANHNILRDPPFLRLDIVSCRNLLIYLQRETQRRVLELFHFALRPGGIVFLGSSESVDEASRVFGVVDKKHRIFRSLQVSDPPLPRNLRVSSQHQVSVPRSSDPLARFDGAAAVHRRLLEAYAPPSIVVNRSGEIVHLSDTAGQFLEVQGGEPSRDLIALVNPGIRAKLKSLLARALVHAEGGVEKELRLSSGGRERIVDIVTKPVAGESADETLALVMFYESATAEQQAGDEGAAPRTRRSKAVARLEGLLAEARAHTQQILEEHEGTIEDLKAANEELQSINEEQRATEEELEASKEELQSINEELQTINQEFRSKNEQLAEVNADLINLIDSTDIGTIFLDRQLRVRRFTPAIASIFNVRASDIGRPLSDLTHRLDYANLEEDGREVLRTLSRSAHEVRSDGGAWYTVRISPYRSLDDRIDGVVLTLFDTTERKLAEQSREHLLEEAQAVSVAKSNFIGVMSHELRTPLNAILGYARVMSEGAAGAVSELQMHHLDRISASAVHLAQMIDDSLQTVRLEAGVTTVVLEQVDIASILSEVAAAIVPLAAAKQLQFVVDANEGRPIMADATKLRQILFNLLGNALRYTDRGSITLRGRMTETEACISVEDTGIGITPEDIERIFERFWQADQSLTRVRGGTGLGLMVARSLARAMKGDLTVTSEVGVGSKFELRLPVIR